MKPIGKHAAGAMFGLLYDYKARIFELEKENARLRGAIELHQKLFWDAWPDKDAIIKRDRALWSALEGDA